MAIRRLVGRLIIDAINNSASQKTPAASGPTHEAQPPHEKMPTRPSFEEFDDPRIDTTLDEIKDHRARFFSAKTAPAQTMESYRHAQASRLNALFYYHPQLKLSDIEADLPTKDDKISVELQIDLEKKIQRREQLQTAISQYVRNLGSNDYKLEAGTLLEFRELVGVRRFNKWCKDTCAAVFRADEVAKMENALQEQAKAEQVAKGSKKEASTAGREIRIR